MKRIIAFSTCLKYLAVVLAAMLLAVSARADVTGHWVADDLDDGDVFGWINRVPENNSALLGYNTDVPGGLPSPTNDPAAIPGALNGHKVVRFDGDDRLLVESGVGNPMANVTDFTITTVFRTNTPGAAGVGGPDQWWSNSGLVSMERPGGVADWGLVFNQNGQVVAGMGGPDRGFASALTPTPGLADGQPHVATFVHTGNQIRLFVDTHFHGRLVGVATSPRQDQPFSFGSAQTFGDGGAHFTGDIAEILLDNTGVTDEDVVALQNNLVTTYGITIPPPPPPPPLPPSGLRGWWTADDLLDDNGSPVSTWTDRVAMRQANAPVDVARRPTLVTDSLNFNGHNAIAFNGAEQDQLRVAGANSPMAGNESFTISVVFRTENAGVGDTGSQWWSNTGIVDAEQPGGTADWGLAFNSAGQIAGGIGGPDVTVNSAGGLNDGDAHIAIFRHDSLTGEVFVTVDGVTTMGSGAALSTARNVADMVFGAIQTNEADRHFTGEIADIRIQADFLSDAATMALYDELFGTYIVPEPGTLFSAMIALAIGAAVWRRRRVAGS